MSYLPIASGVLFLLVLVWAGARGWQKPYHRQLRFREAWATGAHLGAAELAGLVVAITILSFMLHPLQSILLRALQTQRPYWARHLQARRSHKLRARATFEGITGEPGREEIQNAGLAGHELRRRFSLAKGDQALKATGFGNAIAAAADQAGRPYGLDTAVAWPRLYPVLSDPVRAVVDDRRDSMDAAARMVVVMAATAAVCGVLLCRVGWWCLLILIPAGLAALAYFAAVQAALAYGEAVRVAFDLHRLDLLNALGIEIPSSHSGQRGVFEALSDFWRQGIPLPDSIVTNVKAEGE